jgi:membrane fusion protein, multidrug efflux system
VGGADVTLERRAAIAVLLLLALGLGACGQSSQAKSERRESGGPPSQTPDRPAVRITTAAVEARAVQRSVETVGSMLAWEEVVAKSQAIGTVLRLHADLGDRVRAGETLADLDRREADLGLEQLQADLVAGREGLARARATAEASWANLQRTRGSRPALAADVDRARADAQWKRLELERNQELAAKQLIATRDVDNSRAQHQMAEAQVQMAETTLAQHGEQVQAAEAQLAADLGAVKAAEAQVRQREAALDLGRKRVGDTTVPAPITGLVAKRHTSVGEFVKDNAPLFTLVAIDPLKYTGTIPERFAPEVRAGQEVQLQVEAYPGRTFPGQVTRIAPAVDVQTRTLALEARVPNGPGLLGPGFFARGGILTRREAQAAFVPAEAVAYFVGMTKVFVIAGDRAVERQVKTGSRDGARVEVLEGVKPGETVAVSGLAQLYDGAPVEVAAAPAAPARPSAKP